MACLVFAGLVLAASTIPAASAAVVTESSPQTVHHYRVIDLGTLGGKSSDAVAVNQRGDAVGESATRSGLSHAFLWRHGKMIDLGTLGGNTSVAIAVNNRDQVVGASDMPGNRTEHAFFWQRGKMTDLGTLIGGSSLALAINDRGQVVGISYTSAGDQGFLWQRGKMTDLGVMTANDINNAGEIVGETMFGDVLHAYLLRHGKLINLGQLPSSFIYSDAMLINQRGQIAGVSDSPNDEEFPVLWQHRKLISLGTPAGIGPVALNDHGEVLVPPDLLWYRGHVTDLTTLGVLNANLQGINDRGELAGSIFIPRADTSHAALWR